jgi:hypothetical protein
MNDSGDPVREVIRAADRLLDTAQELKDMPYPDVRSLGVTLQHQAITVLRLLGSLPEPSGQQPLQPGAFTVNLATA